ncbi:MAG: MotA/TolQ/ExbB proton channel family protein [Azovibrio sp.]|uniref:MotA/TolQ/ExbB proton channel family protein n=1 Tax=Azovibrio sp. TaxID=1872673 RepID=UPI003C712EEB
MQTLEFAQLWNHTDNIGRAVALVLILMSITSWSVILGRGWDVWRLRRCLPTALSRFWSAPSLEGGHQLLLETPCSRLLAPLSAAALELGPAARHPGFDYPGQLTRSLRRALAEITMTLESGLTLLASTAAVAPFVGLFGTVWGIYHALLGISRASSVQLDVVAGPVGEALIMTAAGLFVAIPAVLAYNFLNRANRILMAAADGFAHDLYAQATAGEAWRPLEPRRPRVVGA